MAESFFEFREKLTAKTPAPAAPPETVTVTQLTRQIEKALRQGLPATFLVKGEISNFKRHGPSGILYFTLKDPTSCIDCLMFRDEAARVKFTPKDGMELLASGSVKVYAIRGKYQLYVTNLQPLGQGALELAFQQLRQKLEREGLFAESRKKPLPEYPMRVAIVTAMGGAALQDVLKVLKRFTFLQLFLYPVAVQGAGSAPQIAGALTHLSRRAGDVGGVDLILLARGGGSLEDLWAFNEEVVARAIAVSKIPIVTGIGHEVDTSIADLVADHHAHTPTEAAQVVTMQWRIIERQIDQTRFRLARALRDSASSCRHRLDGVRRHEFFRRPFDLVNAYRQRLDDRQHAMRVAINARVKHLQRDIREWEQSLLAHHPRHQIDLARQRLGTTGDRLHSSITILQQRRLAQIDSLDRALRLASPESVLRRGFSVTLLKKDNSVVRSADKIKGGERLITRLADGSIESTADDPKQPKLF
jgi:exodeoxyribonuclease VII large subunit